MRFNPRRRAGVSSIVGAIFFVLIMVVAIASLVTIFNAFNSYNSQVNQASNSNLQAADTQLSVTSGQFGAFPPSTTSNFNVATACLATSTSPTNREKVFYTASMWWEFYTCNSAYQYSTSFDGVTWSAETSIPSVVSGYTVGPDFDVEVVGTTLYLAIAKVGSPDFQLGIGTLEEGGTDSAPDGSIVWTDAPATVVAGATNALGPINMAVDGAGNQWVAVVQGTCTTTTNCAIAMYEHLACATTSADGWEATGASCTSATAPTNYAPTALGTLSPNAHMIIFPTPTSFGTVGCILLYETGSTTGSSTGTLGEITQTTLATATWNTITLTGLSDYALTSSSATFIGTSFYFAGLANAAVGQTTGTLDFWSISFSSMTAGTNTAQTTIESTTQAWMGALTSEGTTLALFDSYPTDTVIQYYTSSTLGSIWSSPAITLESAETSVNGLSPAAGAFAVTWTNTALNVRFAALSSFVLSNTSPFAVHVVDVYVYNPSTNALVAHWYYNSTEEFDYWVGQGSTMTIPIRFIWSASTSYLVTFATDAGVTAQTTLTTLPGTTASCPTGQFYNEISPLDECSSTASTNPYLTSGAGTSTCTDTTATTAEMMGSGMGYTTSASSSGNLFLSFAFQITSPTTATGSSTWELRYGTGTAPTCNTAAAGTALGETFTVASQVGAAGDELEQAQTVAVSIAGLAPATTYWFDVQSSDSSAAAWIYSDPTLAVTDLLTTNSPTFSTSASANTCTDATATTAHMMGFATTFTTGGTGFTGTEYGQLSFNIASAATSGINTAYTVRYGTGAAPACNAVAAGTATAEAYTFASQAAVVGGSGQSVGFVLTGLTASTTYWVDVQAVDSTAANWIYSDPVLAVMNLPTAGTNSLPTAAATADTNTCSDVTATTYEQMGFNLKYNIPSSAEGDYFFTITFQVTIPATAAGLDSVWQASYQTGLAPTCNTPETGTTIGNSYTVWSQAAVAGGKSESETFVIQNVQRVAGTTIWVDVQAYDSTGATWIYSNPTLAVAAFPE